MEELRSLVSTWLLIYMVLLVFVALTAVSTLGVPTANFLAIVGAAGLAIGLALKWVNSGDYGNVRSDLLERIKRVLDKYSLSIPAEQRALLVATQTASK